MLVPEIERICRRQGTYARLLPTNSPLRSIILNHARRSQMSDDLSLGESVRRALQRWISAALKWCFQHGTVIGFALTFALFTYVGVKLYHIQLGKEIIVLTSARGTSSWRSGDDVASEISQCERFPGIPFTARVEVTGGIEEIRDRIKGDSRGNTIGYFLNETATPDNMAV